MLAARRIASLVPVCCLLVLAYYAVLLTRADLLLSENTLESVRAATHLVPGNAAYRGLLAEYMEAAGANPDQELEIATQLSPRESRFWIRRGFRAEVEQKYGEA